MEPEAQRQNNAAEVQPLQEARSRFVVEMRKNKRSNLIANKRQENLVLDEKTIATTHDNSESADLKQKLASFLRSSYEGYPLDQLIHKFRTGDLVEMHEGLIGIRKYLSTNNSEISLEYKIQGVIDGNIVPKLIQTMIQTQYPRLQMEAAWTITNLVAGNSHQCKSVIDKGAIPVIMTLMSSTDEDLIQQLVWGVGNLSCDSAEIRDVLLQWGVIPRVVSIIESSSKYSTVKQGGWLLSNLCRNTPMTDRKYMEQCAAPLYKLVVEEKIQDLKIINDLCWAIVNLTSFDYKLLDILHQSGALVKLVDLFGEGSGPQFQTPLLTVFGNIASGSDNDVDELLKFDILPQIEECLSAQSSTVQDQALRVFQYLAAGTQKQVLKILSSHTLLPKIVSILDTSRKSRNTAMTVLNNLVLSGITQLYSTYSQLSVYSKVVNTLKSTSTSLVLAGLDCVRSMLMVGSEHEQKGQPNVLKQQLERSGLIEELEGLQLNPQISIYEASFKIIDKFFV